MKEAVLKFLLHTNPEMSQCWYENLHLKALVRGRFQNVFLMTEGRLASGFHWQDKLIFHSLQLCPCLLLHRKVEIKILNQVGRISHYDQLNTVWSSKWIIFSSVSPFPLLYFLFWKWCCCMFPLFSQAHQRLFIYMKMQHYIKGKQWKFTQVVYLVWLMKLGWNKTNFVWTWRLFEYILIACIQLIM